MPHAVLLIPGHVLLACWPAWPGLRVSSVARMHQLCIRQGPRHVRLDVIAAAASAPQRASRNNAALRLNLIRRVPVARLGSAPSCSAGLLSAFLGLAAVRVSIARSSSCATRSPHVQQQHAAVKRTNAHLQMTLRAARGPCRHGSSIRQPASAPHGRRAIADVRPTSPL